MNEQRAFTVVVTGCHNCPNQTYDTATACYYCGEKGTERERHRRYDESYEAITPTCPMWNEAKPIGELK